MNAVGAQAKTAKQNGFITHFVSKNGISASRTTFITRQMPVSALLITIISKKPSIPMLGTNKTTSRIRRAESKTETLKTNPC